MAKVPPPSPERDRRLAAQPRYRARRAQAIGDVVGSWMRSPDAQRIRRFRAIKQALASVLDDDALNAVEAVRFAHGTLTLAVDDHLLLSELRNHHYRALIHALASAGTGVGRIVFRVARGRH